MIKFQMQDGNVVDAVKDCGCSHHDGPHWLHMDGVYQKYAANTLRRGDTMEAAAIERDRRLEKLYQMHIHGIAHIITLPAPPPDPQPDYVAPPPHTLGFVRGVISAAIAKYGEDAECQFVGCYGATGEIEDFGTYDDEPDTVNLYTTFCSG